MVPRNLNDFTVVTVLLMMVSAGGGELQVVKTAPDSQIFSPLFVSRT